MVHCVFGIDVQVVGMCERPKELFAMRQPCSVASAFEQNRYMSPDAVPGESWANATGPVQPVMLVAAQLLEVVMMP